ncbi:type II toxin-antitoxin system RelE/ParE family toxin [bacterium]|nr:type II toxin-antitoxin system RelE/ParE family toxin [bacterium]
MMRRIIWSPEAVEDLESIHDFIARDSTAYAKSVVERIIQTAKQIPQFPYSGRIVPELNQKSIREKFVFNYRLFYRVAEKEILIITILHDKRQL